MVQYLNSTKTCYLSEKDGTILKQSQNLSTVRKRWYNTQTVPKPVTSQKKMVQYSNRAKTCHQSEKVGSILKQSQNLLPVRKRCKILKQSQNLSTVKTRWCNSQIEQTCHQSEKDGTILKQSQNLSPVRERWYNTQTVPKPDNSQKKDGAILKQNKIVTSEKTMVQYSNSAKTC